jgi:seryl-tRNA synthetase
VIDLRLVRENPDLVRASQRARGADESLVDKLLAADSARREAVTRADHLRAEQKTASQAVKKASPEERPAVLDRAKALAAEVKEAEEAQRAADAALREVHLKIPNVVADEVPPGGEDDAVTLRLVGEVPTWRSGSCSAPSTPSAGRRSPVPASTSSPVRARCWSSRSPSWRSPGRSPRDSCRSSPPRW